MVKPILQVNLGTDNSSWQNGNSLPEQGDFLVRVCVSAELKPNYGFPLLEVAVGYRPDTEILFSSFR